MGKSRGIRHRLLTILLLGVIVSALSLAALIHLLSTTTHQRVERARDAMSEELGRLASDPRRLTEPAPFSVVGMRGGRTKVGESLVTVPAAWAPSVTDTVRETERRGIPTTRDVPLGNSMLVLSARPASGGDIAWAGFLVQPLPSLRTWQWIVTLLALATAGLVATTVYAIVTVQRGATDLRRALAALATDLSAPIPRPTVQELASVAEGVQRLADGLAEARREEGRLQRELSRQERLAALGRVAAGVAHEVRNPLASIKLRLDLAAASTALPVEVEKAISHATTEIGRLDRLVADLLIVAGPATSPRHPTSIGSLVRARTELLTPWARERNVEIAAHGEATADVDGDAVARSVDNLLRNAVEASPTREQVDVRVRTLGDHVVVTVEDHGSGVPSTHSAELFEPFFTTKPDGTGLGLALSRAIARAHGGELSYARSGDTTRFELSFRRSETRALPVDTKPAAPEKQPSSAAL